MSYTDDDGTNWPVSQGSGIASGIDHHPNLPRPAYPNAVYYCAQEWWPTAPRAWVGATPSGRQ
jgi:hypothetical protein